MNKYQEPFNNIVVEAELMAERCGHKLEEDIKLVQELVDKATPKKPNKRYYTTPHGNNGKVTRVDIRCPICGSPFEDGCGNRSIGLFKSREQAFIMLIHSQKYCRICGNAIDWSEEE